MIKVYNKELLFMIDLPRELIRNRCDLDKSKLLKYSRGNK